MSEDPLDYGSIDRESRVKLITLGRRSARSHAVVIWFAYESGWFYFLAHARDHHRGTDWYQNLVSAGEALVEVQGETRRIRADPFEDRKQGLETCLSRFRHKYGDVVDQWYEPDFRIPVRASVLGSGEAGGA